MLYRYTWLVLLACVAGLASGRVQWDEEALPPSVRLRGERFDAGSLRVRARLSGGKGKRRAWDGGVEQPMLLHVKGGTDARVLDRVKAELGVGAAKYVPHNTILVHASPDRVELARAALPEVLWAGPLQPHHKLDPELYPLFESGEDAAGSAGDGGGNGGSSLGGGVSRRLLGRGGGVELAVLMSRGGRGGHEVAAEWGDYMRWRGFEGVSVRAASHKKVIVVTSDSGGGAAAEVVEWLTQQPDAVWVEKRPEFKLLNKWARGIMQSGEAAKTPLWERGLQGQGQVLGIADTGMSMNLCFFWDPDHPVPFNRLNKDHRKVIKYRFEAPYGSNTDEEGHGTHTAGSLAGDAPVGSAEAAFNGMAPKAKIFFDDIYANGGLSPPDDLEADLFPEPFEAGAKIRSESWGGDSISYTSSAMEADAFTHDHRDFLVVWAGGNEGDKGMFTIGSPATGKNMLSVGAQNSASASLELQRSDVHFFEVKQGGDTVVVEGIWASFGTRTEFTGEIVEGFPADACADMTNSAALKGKIALVHRGTCLFTAKARSVQAAGAKAMLVADNSFSSTTIMGGEDKEGITIPSLAISRADGNAITSMIQAGGATLSWDAGGEDMWPQNLASFSAKGPTNDGRLKPEVLTVGADIWSARAAPGAYDGQCHGVPPTLGASVTDMGGTSMAAPVAAGGVALIRQYFTEGWFPSGAAKASDGFSPSSALLRAVVINGARALQGFREEFGEGEGRWEVLDSALPNNFQGWGAMRLAASVTLDPPVEGQPSKLLIRDESGPHAARCLHTGDAYVLSLDVRAGEALRVTLTWTDPAATTVAEVILINDLDLTVAGPDGKVRVGNAIESRDQSGDVREIYDRLNNQETVILERPSAGVHTVTVRGFAVPEGPQCFALAISGDIDSKGEAEAACAGGCGAHGSCEAGVCVCDELWAGVACEEEIELVTKTTTFTSTVWAYGWNYYAIDLGAGGSFDIAFKRLGQAGDPDMYLVEGTDVLPSYKDYAWACKCPNDNSKVCDCRELSCDSCDDTKGNVLHHLESSPLKQLSGRYLLGVSGFCCEAAQYQLTITLTVTGCDSKVGSGKVNDKCGVCGGDNACAGCDGVPNSDKVKDACGVCGGNGSSCVGCDGVANSGKVVDVCGECGGGGGSCLGCDGEPNSGKVDDACGVCGGNGTTCVGCDGMPQSGKVLDACGVCGGGGDSCAGCDGVPNSGKEVDVCGECGGNGSACVGCDGVANSGKVRDRCGVCGGRGDTCVVDGEDAVLQASFVLRPLTAASMQGEPLDVFLKTLALACLLPPANITAVSVTDQRRRGAQRRWGDAASNALSGALGALVGATWGLRADGVAAATGGGAAVGIDVRISVGTAGGQKAADVTRLVGQVGKGMLDAELAQRLGVPGLKVTLGAEPRLVPAWAGVPAGSSALQVLLDRLPSVSSLSAPQAGLGVLLAYIFVGACVNCGLYGRKSRRVPKPRVALFLWATFGLLGAHRFYTRHTKVGLVMFLTLGLAGIGWLLDLFLHRHFLFHAGRRTPRAVQSLRQLAKSNFGDIVKQNRKGRRRYQKGLDGGGLELADEDEFEDVELSQEHQGTQLPESLASAPPTTPSHERRGSAHKHKRQIMPLAVRRRDSTHEEREAFVGDRWGAGRKGPGAADSV